MADESKISDEDVTLVARALWEHDLSFGDSEYEPSDSPTDVYYSDAQAVLERLTGAGRLLPPGGEVTEETEWAVQHKLDNGNVNTSNPFYRREHAEWRTWGFHFGQQEPGVVVRRRIWAGPWSPVVSDNSEVPSA